jgi:hypothetical protein
VPGAPFKPSFGLSGAVRRLDRVSLPLAHDFLPSTRTQFPLVLRTLLRADESCSTANLPDVDGSDRVEVLRFAQDDKSRRVTEFREVLVTVSFD